MARINVDAELYIDPRFRALVRRLAGDDEKAIGKLVQFWAAAQKHWGDEMALVPEQEFKQADWQVLLDVGFAERKDGGIKALESEERFHWYLDLCRKSQKGVRARRLKREIQQSTVGSTQGSTAGLTEGSTVGLTHRVNPRDNPPTPSLAPSPSLKQNPLYPPAGGGKNCKRKTRPSDEADQITGAVTSIVLSPPLNMPPEDAAAEIKRRVPEAGRIVVERMVGADGWPMFVRDAQTEIRNGFMPAFHKRLRKAILAELRSPVSEGAP